MRAEGRFLRSKRRGGGERKGKGEGEKEREGRFEEGMSAREHTFEGWNRGEEEVEGSGKVEGIKMLRVRTGLRARERRSNRLGQG